MKSAVRWGVIERYNTPNHLAYVNFPDSYRGRHRCPALFPTRAAARAWIEDNWGYLRTRFDLKSAPHGWKMPVPVRVVVTTDIRSGKQ
jgi:hypothetical protein